MNYLALRFVVKGSTSWTIRHPVGVQLPAKGDMVVIPASDTFGQLEILTSPQFEYSETNGAEHQLVFVNYFVK